MSLDITLTSGTKEKECVHCGSKYRLSNVVFKANITHNLNKMALEAGIYYHVWRPEEIGVAFAEELIQPLEKAISDMEAHPDRYKKFDSPNGWGLYIHFLPWLKNYLNACKTFPKSTISVSR